MVILEKKLVKQLFLAKSIWVIAIQYFSEKVPPKMFDKMRCAIWYHLCNLKNVENTYGGVLHLIKWQAEASNFNKSNTPPWVFFTFFKCTNGTKLRNASHMFGKILNTPLTFTAN